MKRYVSAMIVMMGLCVLPLSNLEAGSEKIGVLDLQKCFMESKEGKKIIQELKKKKDALQKKFDKRQNAFLKLQEELKKQSMMLSADARMNKEREFERMRRELKYTYDDLIGEMRQAEIEAKKKVFKEMETVINEIGKKGAYFLIMERRAGGIMYYGKAVDITDEVIKAYDLMKR
ncbi:MAG: OmpH family outer membrane protein [Deltaproteobacteria bacterium]|nr:OmpH family outer membrane protein [Deltaproteobacteria bacterium]